MSEDVYRDKPGDALNDRVRVAWCPYCRGTTVNPQRPWCECGAELSPQMRIVEPGTRINFGGVE